MFRTPDVCGTATSKRWTYREQILGIHSRMIPIARIGRLRLAEKSMRMHVHGLDASSAAKYSKKYKKMQVLARRARTPNGNVYFWRLQAPKCAFPKSTAQKPVLKKTNIFHPSSQAPGPGPGLVPPGPRPRACEEGWKI